MNIYWSQHNRMNINKTTQPNIYPRVYNKVVVLFNPCVDKRAIRKQVALNPWERNSVLINN